MFFETLEQKLRTVGYKPTKTEEACLNFSPGINPEDIERIGKNVGYEPGTLPSTSHGTRKTFARTRAEPGVTLTDVVTVYYAEQNLPGGESTIYHLMADRKHVFYATGNGAFEAKLRPAEDGASFATFEGVSEITIPIALASPTIDLISKRPVNPNSPYLVKTSMSLEEQHVEHTLKELRILEGESVIRAFSNVRRLNELYSNPEGGLK